MEELNKDSLTVDEKIVAFFNKSEKIKKYLALKIQLIK